MARFHPAQEWLLDYVAGHLNESYRLVIATHMEVCSECRTQVANLQKVGAQMLQDLAPTSLAANALARTLMRAQTGAAAALPLREKPASLMHKLMHPSQPLVWKRQGTALRVAKLMNRDGVQASLLHISAGARMPEHTHNGNEMTLILKGAFSDQFGRYDVGDVMLMDPEHTHTPIASSDEDCYCLVAQQGALHFTGPVLRWFNPVLQKLM